MPLCVWLVPLNNVCSTRGCNIMGYWVALPIPSLCNNLQYITIEMWAWLIYKAHCGVFVLNMNCACFVDASVFVFVFVFVSVLLPKQGKTSSEPGTSRGLCRSIISYCALDCPIPKPLFQTFQNMNIKHHCKYMINIFSDPLLGCALAIYTLHIHPGKIAEKCVNWGGNLFATKVR